MLNLEKIDLTKTQDYIASIYSKRAVLFNYFGQTFEHDDKYFETKESFILAKPAADFYRIYLASNNKNDIIKILSGLEGVCVVNFPTKNNIRDIDTIMTESGYKQISIFERYICNVQDLELSAEDMATISVASEADENEIFNLYSNWKDFNPYIDWFPSHKELKELIENKTVLINRQNNKIVGANIFSLNKKLFKWYMMIDLSGNAIKLASAMFVMMMGNGIKSFTFWVNSLNKKSINFHKRLGAVPDGLKDYTYIKK